MRVVVYPSPDDVAVAAAQIIEAELAVPGPATLGLAGGTTPLATYRNLSAAAVEWSRVTLWLGDERWVPTTDPASNSGMAMRELGGAAGVSLLAPAFRPGDPDGAARAYEGRLNQAFAEHGGAPDTVLLGIGSDGHTASLFPGTTALNAEDPGYVANWVPALQGWRLTATVGLLAASRHVVFIVTGGEKAAVVAEIVDDAIAHPARLVAEKARNVTWVLDAAAAAGLRSQRRRS
jgi:6-phosphogluconolactonase